MPNNGDAVLSAIQPGVMVVNHKAQGEGLRIGFVQDVRGSRAKVEFRPSVFSEPPYQRISRVFPLEDLTRVDSPAERLRDANIEEPWKFQLRQRAAHLLVCNRDGQLSNARTDLVPHQVTIAHDVVASPRRRFLVADEVGLGKTIEAGMILYALQQRGQARRVLIVTPAGLTHQWQEEMKDKFGLDFVVYRDDVAGIMAFEHHHHIIASIDTLKLDRPREKDNFPGHKSMVLAAQDWDVILFDEAHRLSAKTWSPRKTEKTLNFRLAEDLASRCNALLLLTATPHQGDESKFQNLIGLLHDNVVFDELALALDDAVVYTSLILRNRKSKVTDADGNLIFKGMQVQRCRFPLRGDGERQFHKALTHYLQEGYGFAEQDPASEKHRAIGFVMTTFQKMAASSTVAVKCALERRRDKLLGEAEGVEDAPEIEDDSRYQGELDALEAARVSDSFLAAEVDMLNNLLQMHVSEDAKQGELLEVIDSVSTDEPNQRVLIFTEYRDTQELLEHLLEHHYGEGCATRIRGGMTLWEKHESIEAFRDDPRVRFLVSTEAGGEGINLQFAHTMVNYDIPWNPMRLAQRYGRLYRYGQTEVVQAFNFQNAGTIEDKVQEYLEKKTNSAADRLAKITGETTEEIRESLLGFYDEFIDYERIYRESLAKAELKPSQAAIDEGVRQAEAAYELAYQSLFRHDIAPFNPERFEHEIESPLTLADIEAFIAQFVRRHGRNFSTTPDERRQFITPDCLQGVHALDNRYENGTFDRDTAMRHSETDFMALGHPFTDAAIRYAGSPEFGGFATCRTITEPSLDGVRGVHFNFLVTRVAESSDGDVTSFDLVAVFVLPDGTTDDHAAEVALLSTDTEPGDPSRGSDFDFADLEQTARLTVLEHYADHAPWDEDVFLLNAALTHFEA